MSYAAVDRERLVAGTIGAQKSGNQTFKDGTHWSVLQMAPVYSGLGISAAVVPAKKMAWPAALSAQVQLVKDFPPRQPDAWR